MAPERLNSDRPGSFDDEEAKSDVYSFAVVMWELGTAELPFKGLDIAGVGRRLARLRRLTEPVPHALSTGLFHR